ncbi:hypothetical protein QTP88_012923 [Uroleucon formosanum]
MHRYSAADPEARFLLHTIVYKYKNRILLTYKRKIIYLKTNIHKHDYSDQSHLKRLQVKIQRSALGERKWILSLI